MLKALTVLGLFTLSIGCDGEKAVRFLGEDHQSTESVNTDDTSEVNVQSKEAEAHAEHVDSVPMMNMSPATNDTAVAHGSAAGPEVSDAKALVNASAMQGSMGLTDYINQLQNYQAIIQQQLAQSQAALAAQLGNFGGAVPGLSGQTAAGPAQNAAASIMQMLNPQGTGGAMPAIGSGISSPSATIQNLLNGLQQNKAAVATNGATASEATQSKALQSADGDDGDDVLSGVQESIQNSIAHANDLARNALNPQASTQSLNDLLSGLSIGNPAYANPAFSNSLVNTNTNPLSSLHPVTAPGIGNIMSALPSPGQLNGASSSVNNLLGGLGNVPAANNLSSMLAALNPAAHNNLMYGFGAPLANQGGNTLDSLTNQIQNSLSSLGSGLGGGLGSGLSTINNLTGASNAATNAAQNAPYAASNAAQDYMNYYNNLVQQMNQSLGLLGRRRLQNLQVNPVDLSNLLKNLSFLSAQSPSITNLGPTALSTVSIPPSSALQANSGAQQARRGFTGVGAAPAQPQNVVAAQNDGAQQLQGYVAPAWMVNSNPVLGQLLGQQVAPSVPVNTKRYTIGDLIETLSKGDVNVTNLVKDIAESDLDLNRLVRSIVSNRPSLDEFLRTLADSDVDVKSFLKRVVDKDVDVNLLIKELAYSNVSLDAILKNLANGGVDFNRVIKSLADSKLDIDNGLSKLAATGIDASLVLNSPALPGMVNSGVLTNPQLGELLGSLPTSK